MLSGLHQVLLYTHIIAGSIALIVFWLPALNRKGSNQHKKIGRIYLTIMYLLSISGVVMSLMVLVDPMAIRQQAPQSSGEQALSFIEQQRMVALFLLTLSILVLSNARQGYLSVKYKSDLTQLRTPTHVALIVSLPIVSAVLMYIGILTMQPLFLIFAVVGLGNGIGMIRFVMQRQHQSKDWLICHLNNLIGTGIGIYTAFFAFGARQFLSQLLPGLWMLVPWILPAVIGIVVTRRLTKRYQQSKPKTLSSPQQRVSKKDTAVISNQPLPQKSS
ncbi:hypothetical protein [Thalassotalea sp. Y01]|uniref:hypothetical protein n=1 Tax=Thalassotalea sp. Y01 TaxID=2729613 RepID=UPI00145EACC3|nr:hypothetical protein [Thalassotalea sp. Y01]NMP17473.1 hypothetical protein [Thalassotalea sp. Y01]